MTALLLGALVATAQPPAPAAPGIFAVTTVSYAPGEADPPGNHGYDVVLVPIDEGMTVQIDGAPANWTPGVPLIVSRGAPHTLKNATDHTVSFVEVRTVGDNAAGNDATLSATGATIVRSTVGKYVRATVWRLERSGHVEWPPDVVHVIIARRPVDARGESADPKMVMTSILSGPQDRSDNLLAVPIELVRISRMANP